MTRQLEFHIAHKLNYQYNYHLKIIVWKGLVACLLSFFLSLFARNKPPLQWVIFGEWVHLPLCCNDVADSSLQIMPIFLRTSFWLTIFLVLFHFWVFLSMTNFYYDEAYVNSLWGPLDKRLGSETLDSRIDVVIKEVLINYIGKLLNFFF